MFDKDTISDDLIGKGIIKMADVVGNEKKNTDNIFTVELKYYGESVGKCRLRIRFITCTE